VDDNIDAGSSASLVDDKLLAENRLMTSKELLDEKGNQSVVEVKAFETTIGSSPTLPLRHLAPSPTRRKPLSWL
jgi:hypothetical protein